MRRTRLLHLFTSAPAAIKCPAIVSCCACTSMWHQCNQGCAGLNTFNARHEPYGDNFRRRIPHTHLANLRVQVVVVVDRPHTPIALALALVRVRERQEQRRVAGVVAMIQVRPVLWVAALPVSHAIPPPALHRPASVFVWSYRFTTTVIGTNGGRCAMPSDIASLMR